MLMRGRGWRASLSPHTPRRYHTWYELSSKNQVSCSNDRSYHPVPEAEHSSRKGACHRKAPIKGHSEAPVQRSSRRARVGELAHPLLPLWVPPKDSPLLSTRCA